MDTLVEWAKALWGLWLMMIFIGIVAYVFWPGRKREMEEHARIPLEDPLEDLERKDGRQD
jgi:cytochrome c oxidase cbb3-type subunit 4